MTGGTLFPTELVTGGFGKLPSFPEVIRVGAGGREIGALDQWIQEGLYHLRQEVGSPWTSLYDTRLFHRFGFRPDNCGLSVLGVIRAAMDELGRRFPFVAFGMLPTRLIDAYPLYIPSILDANYGQLEQTIEDVKFLQDQNSLRDRLQRPCVTPLPTLADEERYQAFLDDTLCSELGCFGPERSVALLSHIIWSLRRVRVHPRTLPVCLEFPLGHSPYARGLEIRFWLELCMILLNWYPPTLSFFWQTGMPTPRTSSLLVCFRHPPGHMLGAMVLPDVQARGVWYPDQNQGLSAAMGPAGPPVPVEGHFSLRWLFEQLCPGYPGECRWYRPAEVVWR